MRILLIHASKFSFHVTEKTSAVSSLAELGEDQLKGSVGDVLVAFMASEKADEKGIDSVAQQAADTIADQAAQVKTADVMLYPYAHLSSDLSSPRVATKVLAAIGKMMRDELQAHRPRGALRLLQGLRDRVQGPPAVGAREDHRAGRRGRRRRSRGRRGGRVRRSRGREEPEVGMAGAVPRRTRRAGARVQLRGPRLLQADVRLRALGHADLERAAGSHRD